MVNNYSEGCNFFEAFSGELMQDAVRKFAVENKIPLIALGYTPEQCKHMLYPEIKPFYPTSYKMTPEYQRTLFRETIHGESMKEVFSEEEYNYFWNGPKQDLKAVLPTMLYPFLSWGYDKDKITEEVQKMHSIKNMHPFITNNVMVILFCDYKRLGYCTVEPEWADMVRKGIADWQNNLSCWQGFEYLVLNHEDLFYAGLDRLISSLGLTKSEFKTYLTKPHVNH